MQVRARQALLDPVQAPLTSPAPSYASLQATQVLVVSHTGDAVGQAPFTPVDESFEAGAQVTHTLLTQAGLSALQCGLVPSLPFCESMQGTHLCVVVSQAGAVPGQSLSPLQPVQVPPVQVGLVGSLQSALSAHCAQKLPESLWKQCCPCVHCGSAVQAWRQAPVGVQMVPPLHSALVLQPRQVPVSQ
jgi:hypothetical protein